MHGTNNGRCVCCPPGRFRELIRFLRIRLQEVFDWAGHLLEPPRLIKQLHLVVLLPHFVGHAARPRLDLVELTSRLVVPRLAHVHLLIRRQSTRPSFIEPRNEHDEASVEHLFDLVVAILARLGHLVLEKVLLEPVHRLLGTVVPASVDPSLSSSVLPSSEYLRDNGFGHVVDITNMHPVAYTMLAPRFILSEWPKDREQNLPTRHAWPLC